MAHLSGEALGRDGKLNIKYVGGEIFRASQEPSELGVLWGELFKESERKFMRQTMTEEVVNFSIHDTFQITCRCLWRPEALKITRLREGKFVMLLHDYKPPLTSCWTWAKFAKPLYRVGYSVVMIDMPGFSRSCVNQISMCDASLWRSVDWHIVSQTLDELRVGKVDTISCGESCQTIIRVMQRSPQQLGTEHLMRNPKFCREELFKPLPRKHDMPDCLRERSVEEELKHQNLVEFFSLLRGPGARIWATFDRKAALRTADTLDFLTHATSNTVCRVGPDGIPHMLFSVAVTEISDTDLCETQIGALVGGVRFLFPSQNLKDAVVCFFMNQGPYSDPRCFVPAERSTLRPPLPASLEMLKPLAPSASAPALLNFESSKTVTENDGLEVHSLSTHAAQRSILSTTSAWTESGGTKGGGTDSMMMKKATTLTEAIKKAKLELPGAVASKRNFLLTKKERHRDVERKVKPKLDKDLLPEEELVLEEVCNDSMRTAYYEDAHRKEERKRMHSLKERTKNLNMSRGVMRYITMAATAMHLSKQRDAAFAMLRRRPE